MLIERIQGPADLGTLSLAELDILAREIRDEVHNVTSQNGGHFASNLGSTELTLALHTVFDSHHTTGSSGTSGTRPIRTSS